MANDSILVMIRIENTVVPSAKKKIETTNHFYPDGNFEIKLAALELPFIDDGLIL